MSSFLARAATRPGATEFPTRPDSTPPRRQRIRARRKANERRIRWQQKHRRQYNAQMRRYRHRRAAAARPSSPSVP
jgi:hypothetical protein